MKKFLILFILLLTNISYAQDRNNKLEVASFLSVGRIGLNYVGIAPDIQNFIGPAYSFNENSSVMIGFSVNFDTSPTKPAMVSLFAGGNFSQYIGAGYAFDLTTREIAYIDETTKERELRTLYKTRHSILIGALARNNDFE